MGEVTHHSLMESMQNKQPRPSDHILPNFCLQSHLVPPINIPFSILTFLQDCNTYNWNCLYFCFIVKVLEPAAVTTADFVLFLDKLFDSLNGFLTTPTEDKDLYTVIRENSKHHTFWVDAIKTLETIEFVTEGRWKNIINLRIPRKFGILS